MKRFLVQTYWRATQYGAHGETTPMQPGKQIIIEAKNLRSAENKAAKKNTVYTHYEVIGEAE